MTPGLILKAALIWLGIACLAVVNGLVRENLFVPQFGTGVALLLSGLLLALIIFLVTYLSFNFIHGNKPRYFLVGLQWVFMTLAFEFLFGHFVAGKSWNELVQIFDITEGDLMLLVLLVTLLSPYWVSRLKRQV